jgi:uncharacterized membrane protein YccC
MDGLGATRDGQPRPDAWASFWQTVTRFQDDKVAPALGLRNALGVAIPLVVGLAAGSLLSGLAVSTGALNVAFSDSSDPYPQRSRQMLRATALVAIAVMVGGLCANNHDAALLIATLWAFAAGMLVALGQTAADIGGLSLVVLIVFAAQPLTPGKAVNAGLLALLGGLFQMALSLALWPVRPFSPERHALGELYLELSRALDSPIRSSAAPPATSQSNQAQMSLSTLGQNHSIEGERYRLLLSQAERIRLSLLTLSSLRRRLAQDPEGGAFVEILDRCFAICSNLLGAVGKLLLNNEPVVDGPELIKELQTFGERLRAAAPEWPEPLATIAPDARFQIDALAGQFRSVLDLATHATPEGLQAFEQEQATKPWALRLGGRLAKLRANLTLESAACRHAVRLAACVAIGEGLSWSVGWRRSYWIPMTVAIVLKPDFTATFSRGVLRLVGTLIGIVLTTALFLLLHPWEGLQIALIGVLMFIVRCYGPANYGIFVTAITALVVLLISVAGMSHGAAPAGVIAARGWNTVVGGGIALFAYAIWPTWERTQFSETMADMLDAYRNYFRVIRESYLQPDGSFAQALDSARLAGRLARANLEASVDRLSSEPGASPEALSLLSAMLASSHRLAHAMLALEAGMEQSQPVPARNPFRTLANHVEITLHSLAAALRGSPLTAGDLPDLREDHHALVATGDSLAERYALVNAETDRITNSLNTLSEEVLRWRMLQPAGVTEIPAS